MDLGEILRVLRNRWSIMLPMMLLTGGLTAFAYIMVPTHYVSHSTVSLLSAERATTIGTKGNSNPFLTFDSSLVATADFLSRSLTSNESKVELKQLGVTEEYTAGLADNAQGPFVTLKVTGTDSKHVLASTELLAEFAARKLREIQAGSGVKPEDMVRLTQITPAQTPEPKLKDKMEIVIGAAGGGTTLAFVITFIVEGLARSRRWPRQAPQPVVAAVQPRNTRAGSAADVTDTAISLPLTDQTLIMPRIPVEFYEPVVGKTKAGMKAEAKTETKAKMADEGGELLVLGQNGSAAPKPGNAPAWSTVYRSNGKAGQPRDADPIAGD